MTDVAIVGIGISPFGRHEGRSGLFQGATAVRRALADAGLTWNDVQFATGGSQDAGNADTMVNVLGLTGLPFFNIANGCATGGSSLSIACSLISAGTYDIGVVVGFDKHKRGAFDRIRRLGPRRLVGDTGLMLTTQFFAMKISATCTTTRLAEHPVEGRCEGVPQRCGNERVAANTLDRGGIEGSTMLAAPDAIHVLPARRVASHCRLPRRTRVPVHLEARLRPLTVVRSRRYAFEVFSSWLAPERTPSRRSKPRRRVRGGRHRRRRPHRPARGTSGAEVMPWPRPAYAQTASRGRRRVGCDGTRRHAPINTDGGCIANGEPVGASASARSTSVLSARRRRGPPGPLRAAGRALPSTALRRQRLHGA
jgi:hypothetical protein